MRGVAKEDPAVLEALARLRDQEAESEGKRRSAVDHTNMLELKKRKLVGEIEGAKADLARQKAKLLEVQRLTETAVAVKRFSPEMLGAGHAKGGTAANRKQRFDLMDRIASLGSGLSAEQQNDWTWFKEAWDKKMAEAHKEAWGTTFAGWIQGVLEKMREANNAMSVFVYDETVRCFSDACGVLA